MRTADRNNAPSALTHPDLGFFFGGNERKVSQMGIFGDMIRSVLLVQTSYAIGPRLRVATAKYVAIVDISSTVFAPWY